MNMTSKQREEYEWGQAMLARWLESSMNIFRNHLQTGGPHSITDLASKIPENHAIHCWQSLLHPGKKIPRELHPPTFEGQKFLAEKAIEKLVQDGCVRRSRVGPADMVELIVPTSVSVASSQLADDLADGVDTGGEGDEVEHIPIESDKAAKKWKFVSMPKKRLHSEPEAEPQLRTRDDDDELVIDQGRRVILDCLERRPLWQVDDLMYSVQGWIACRGDELKGTERFGEAWKKADITKRAKLLIRIIGDLESEGRISYTKSHVELILKPAVPPCEPASSEPTAVLDNSANLPQSICSLNEPDALARLIIALVGQEDARRCLESLGTLLGRAEELTSLLNSARIATTSTN
jgi:hypothetical protein